MPERALVSVIVPHLNDHQRLILCLRSLGAQTWPADRLEIIVIDNGSQTPLDAVLAEFPQVKTAVEPVRGCGSARNRGVAVSSGTILCFTDSDVIASPDWVERMVAGLAQADIVGGRIEVFPEFADFPTAAELYERVFAFRNDVYIRRKRFSVGCSMATRRDVIARVGPFLGSAFPEDLDWGQRASGMGFRLAYAEDAVLRHPARSDRKALRVKVDRTLDHQMNLLRVRLGRWFWLSWLVFLAALCCPPLIKLGQVAASGRLSGWRQRLSVARVLLDLRYHRVRRLLRYALKVEPPPIPPKVSSVEQ